LPEQKAVYRDVGRRIRQARSRRKPRLSQKGLGDLVSLTRTSIVNIEQGRQRMLIHTLYEIADALQVEVSSLLPEKDSSLEVHLQRAIKRVVGSEKKWINSIFIAAKKEQSDVSS
jgi:transcriptional regulator with XRE-family HTH domain